MAKESKAAVPAPSKTSYKVPEGYEKRSGDVEGFVDMGEVGCKVHGIPRGAKLQDSKLDATKPSAFIIFELLEDALGFEGSEEEKTEVPLKKGQMAGVWVKPGMRAILKACGRPVFMVNTGEKKLKNKPAGYSPMKVYDIHVGPGKDSTIPVIDDNRDKSANVSTFLSPKRGAQRMPGEDIDESVDF